MKNWNLIKLRLELGLRWMAITFGSGLSALSIICSFLLSYAKGSSSEYNQELKSINISDLADSVFAVLFAFIIPILVSIFILVATRKIKELNQLIEENKKL